MSILKFLQVVEQALPPLNPSAARQPRPPARRRPLRVERLELRAVLDGDSSMMPPDYTPPEDYSPPDETMPPPDYVPPEDYTPPDDPTLPPDYTPPEDTLPPEETLPPDYTPPEESEPGDGMEDPPYYDLPPYFYDVTHHFMGGSVVIQGFVGDDMPVGGLTVYFSTDLGQTFAVDVEADGYFTTDWLSLPMGTVVSFYTVDSGFNTSENMLLII
jgi:hypothetical protein